MWNQGTNEINLAKGKPSGRKRRSFFFTQFELVPVFRTLVIGRNAGTNALISNLLSLKIHSM